MSGFDEHHHGGGQAQPLRPGDVYPPTAANPEARRQRDVFLAASARHDQQQQQPPRPDDGGLRVTETEDNHTGRRIVTATAGGQVMAQFTVPVPGAGDDSAVTIGEALRAAADTSAGDEPVDLADAAAVQAAEARATGLGHNVPGGVAAAAQKAAQENLEREGGREKKVPLKDVVGGDLVGRGPALAADKVATREDAAKVAAAAERNAASKSGGAGAAGGQGKGVADAVAAAAEMNQARMR
ncbi:late embryogenesis abundant protein D-34 [Brachypodium distachyon]|uniref:SMP domain-containing protein n=1 Tax=Brachypodium distachyon TaxID=15368 RepID=I1H5D6_BRADI|nr:late embryogenesis abundant protein D-34 [Brachypodium distachyon]KQK21651.1 hypothetical protein BRADI_1g62180v3 [Brachypodium distachyon]|eukprot:XP_003561627.1 late embryogenesis abundant protein D-34 [Brachypodium distachyon]